MLKKTYKILNIFAKNLSMIYAFRDIKRLSKSKSESYTYNSLKKFVEEGILIQKKLGNSLLYSIAHNSKAIINLSIASEYEAWNKKHIPYMDIEKLVNKIHTYFFSLLITGSYARDDQKKESDIDIIIISNIDSKKIYAELRHICEMNIPPIHLYVFTEEEFLQMLLDEKSNYGKEIVKNNLILYGGESYYRIIFTAMKNGFTY